MTISQAVPTAPAALVQPVNREVYSPGLDPNNVADLSPLPPYGFVRHRLGYCGWTAILPPNIKLRSPWHHLHQCLPFFLTGRPCGQQDDELPQVLWKACRWLINNQEGNCLMQAEVEQDRGGGGCGRHRCSGAYSQEDYLLHAARQG